MTETLSDLLQEGRTFPPPAGFAKEALVTDASVYDDAERDWQGFWARQALALDWRHEWDTILDWQLPVREVVRRRPAERLRELPRPPPSRRTREPVALHWEGEPGDHTTITYKALHDDVTRRERLRRARC